VDADTARARKEWFREQRAYNQAHAQVNAQHRADCANGLQAALLLLEADAARMERSRGNDEAPE